MTETVQLDPAPGPRRRVIGPFAFTRQSGRWCCNYGNARGAGGYRTPAGALFGLLRWMAREKS